MKPALPARASTATETVITLPWELTFTFASAYVHRLPMTFSIIPKAAHGLAERVDDVADALHAFDASFAGITPDHTPQPVRVQDSL